MYSMHDKDTYNTNGFESTVVSMYTSPVPRNVGSGAIEPFEVKLNGSLNIFPFFSFIASNKLNT